MAQPANTDSPLIVVSYHASDEYWAERLVAQLHHSAGKYGIVIDRVNGERRGRLDDTTQVALKTAKVLILLISPSYLNSTWLSSEEDRRWSAPANTLAVLAQEITTDQLVSFPYTLNLVNSTPLAKATLEGAYSILGKTVTEVALLIERERASLSSQPEVNEPQLTVENLSRLKKSDEVENALHRARRLASTTTIRPRAVTIPAVLFALAEGGRAKVDYFRTPQFLWRELTARGEDAYTKVLIEEFPDLVNLGERAGRNIDSIAGVTELITPNVFMVFDIAEEIARRTVPQQIYKGQKLRAFERPKPEIGTRHLFAALLVFDGDDGPTGARRRLAELVGDVAALRNRFYNFIVKSVPDDDHAAWKKILGDLESPETQTATAEQIGSPNTETTETTNIFTQPAVAGFMADEWNGRDLLGITRDVNALASLVAAYKVEPPLSIGLFGDWGSGKSHFMRQMRKRVELLSRRARESKEPQNKLGYYKNIVQIEFNAWHYIEGNLWASLVDHIFANLKLSEREDPTYAEQRRDELMQKLGVKEDVQKRISSRVQEGENELRKLQERKQQAEAELDKASTQLEGFKEEARSSLEKLSVPGAFTTEEKELLGRLGIDAGTEISAADVRKNYLKMKSGWNSLKARWKLFRTDPRATRRYLLSLLLAAIPIAGALLLKFKGFPGLPTTVATMLGVIATAYVAAKPAWDQFRTSLRALEKHDEEVERKRQQRIAQLESEVTALTKEIVHAKLEGETVGKEVEKLKTDIKNTSSSRILAEFIEDRAAASDYRRHLGLLALIRRDFEKLRDLFDQQRQEEVDGKEAGDDKKINRIVLYIDDLDRCPPDRVVQVLQAIHLLLAFPLFVVVVGVDSRWITRSLQQSYGWLREADEETSNVEKEQAEQNQDDNRGRAAGATPHDYLEKIFQIPFWLRSMNEEACVEFLEGLTKEITDKLEPQLDHRLEHQVSRNEQIEDIAKEVAVAETPAPASVSSVELPFGLTVESTVQSAPLETPQSEIDLAPRSLTFTTFETNYMKKLVPLIGRSPRAVKRFLNCYRLIKVGLTPAEFDNFVGQKGESQSYKAAMILLGVITGAPAVSSYVIDELKLWRGAKEFKLETFKSALVSRPEMLKQPDAERLLRFFNTHDFGASSDALFKEMVSYSPQVSRFSFRVDPNDTSRHRHDGIQLDGAIKAARPSRKGVSQN